MQIIVGKPYTKSTKRPGGTDIKVSVSVKGSKGEVEIVAYGDFVGRKAPKKKSSVWNVYILKGYSYSGKGGMATRTKELVTPNVTYAEALGVAKGVIG